MHPQDSPPSLFTKVIAGLTAGAIAAAMFNPTDILKIRFQADQAGKGQAPRYKSLMDAVVKIIKNEGLFGGLYKGVGTTMIRAALLTSSQLASYDHSKHSLIRYLHFSDNLFTHFIASFIAGLVTTLVTNPVDVVRTRIMNEKVIVGQKRVYRDPFTTFYKILTNEGLKGLYKGFLPSYLRMGACTVMVFVILEKLRTLCGISTI